MIYSCTDYHTYKVKDISSNLKSYLDNKSAVYLFKYDYSNAIDYTSDTKVLESLEKLITSTFHEVREDVVGLFFNTSIELTSKIFGKTKRKLLVDTISKDKLNGYKNIKNLLNIITENQHPLYIGKANKLASRINQHLKGGSQSHLKDNLDEYKINIQDCILSYHYIDDTLDDKTNELFEDIITRILKPGFVRRIG